MKVEIIDKINSIALQEQSHLWDAMAAFVTGGWLEKLATEQQLLILQTTIYAEGDLKDKVSQLNKFDLGSETKKLVAKFQKKLRTQAKTNVLVIEAFILMLQAYLDGILYEHPVLHTYYQLGPLVLQEMRKEIASYTLTGHRPIYECEATGLFDNLNNLYNIIRTVHYLAEYRICETWEQYPVNSYNVLELHQAKCLNAKQAFRAGLNTPDDYQIVFYGQTWVLERINASLKSGLKVAENPNAQQRTCLPFENYSELNRQLQSIQIPETQRVEIKTAFLDSITQIQICMDYCLIDTLPAIKVFAQ